MANKTADEILLGVADEGAGLASQDYYDHEEVAPTVAEASRQLYEAEAALQEPLYRQVAGKPYATDGFKGSSNIYYERVDAIPVNKLRTFYGITETEQEGSAE